MSRQHKLNVDGGRRSVTVTFGYRGELRTLVAKNLRQALADARRRWGEWTTVESVSTPETIYADVTGYTLARHTPGEPTQADMSLRSRLAKAGHEARPDEIGSRRYLRDVLHKIRRDPRHRSKHRWGGR